MVNSRIQPAKETLLALVNSLPNHHCLFNIIGFGSTFESLFPKSVPTNENNISLARSHINSIEANLGGN